MEVDHQAYPVAAQPQIRQQLGMMNSAYPTHSLDLDQHAVIDKHVNPVSVVESNAVIDDWEGHLNGNGAATLSKLVRQASLVSALQQSRSQGDVNLQSRVNDPAARDIHIHGFPKFSARSSLRLCASAVTAVLMPYRSSMRQYGVSETR